VAWKYTCQIKQNSSYTLIGLYIVGWTQVFDKFKNNSMICEVTSWGAIDTKAKCSNNNLQDTK
jgi:hypothetical protein